MAAAQAGHVDLVRRLIKVHLQVSHQGGVGFTKQRNKNVFYSRVNKKILPSHRGFKKYSPYLWVKFCRFVDFDQ